MGKPLSRRNFILGKSLNLATKGRENDNKIKKIISIQNAANVFQKLSNQNAAKEPASLAFEFNVYCLYNYEAM